VGLQERVLDARGSHVQPAGREFLTECIGSAVVACDCDCDGAGDVDASTRFAGLILSTSPEAVTSEKRPVELELSPLMTALCPLSSGREWRPWMRTLADRQNVRSGALLKHSRASVSRREMALASSAATPLARAFSCAIRSRAVVRVSATAAPPPSSLDDPASVMARPASERHRAPRSTASERTAAASSAKGRKPGPVRVEDIPRTFRNRLTACCEFDFYGSIMYCTRISSKQLE